MQALTICQNILEEMKQRILSRYPDSFRLGNHFTRCRKLDIKQVIFYLLYSSKASMNLNIANIRDDLWHINFPDVTKQAVSKARKGIASDFFRDLLHFSVENFYRSYQQRKTWNGFYPFAIDGSCIQVPKSKDNVEHFGLCKNQHHSREDAMARISILYDLLEDIVVDGSVNDYRHAERRSAKKHLEYLEAAGLADEIVSYVPSQLKRDNPDPVQVRVIHVTLDDGTMSALLQTFLTQR